MMKRREGLMRFWNGDLQIMLRLQYLDQVKPELNVWNGAF
ncbi:hypothetical protein PsAD5_00074 [Pseudovibrio sp. Ad5]|nr:hypothetical protein PsAD5_00074 [Pseudovibrio sp. Ad5]